MQESPRQNILLNEKQIQSRVLEIGAEISRDYKGLDPVLIAVLKGAVVFLADLVRAISIPHTFDFVGASSYGSSTESSGEVILTHDASIDLGGRHIILIEDIYDTGRTLASLRDHLSVRHPASIEICAFIVKDRPRESEIPVKYAGFVLPDKFVVGYGLDYDEKYRNLRYIAALSPEEIARAAGEGSL